MKRNLNYDVVIVGGGAAGISAALAASKINQKVLLIERDPSFGGAGVNSQVASYCGFYTRGQKPDLVAGGIGKLVLDKMKEAGINTTAVPSKSTGNVSIKFDPEKMKIIFDDLLSKSNADFLLHASVIGARVEEGKISTVICSDDDGLFTVHGKEFIDASGNGNLLHAAGLKTNWGDKDGNAQQASLSFRIDNLPQHAIGMADIEQAVRKGKKAGIKHLTQERGVFLKEPEASYAFLAAPSIKIDSLDSKNMTKYEMKLRKQVQAYFKVIKKYIAGCENAILTFSGPKIGIREARRMIGEVELKNEDILNATKRSDSIGRAAWSLELHHVNNQLEYVCIPDNEYASIPLGCLKAKGIENLWGAGRLISADHLAQASIRVMGTGFITGQAAGVAAALAINGRTSVEEVRKELVAQGALL
ncbi:FAD-dependent oxidoreductase [Companilactobacillus halodurans]|nr:FAD-dependent oxidoreductase [Companilactobacillus halodurans]